MKNMKYQLRTQKIFRYGDVARFDQELDFLMSYKDALIKDFLTEYNDIEDCLQRGTTDVFETSYRMIMMKKAGKEEYLSIARAKMQVGMDDNSLLKGQSTKGKYNNDAWRALVMKYYNPNIVADESIQKRMLNIKQKHDGYNPDAFPIMKGIAEHYGDICPIIFFSILPAQSIIERHTGHENVEGQNIRIHIPLIVPEGDLFLEVQGEEVDWLHPWGFNNQYIHSAHNNTDEHRLVMLIDLKRTFCGIPPAKHFKDMSIDEIGDVHYRYGRDNKREQPKISSSLRKFT
jgi:hypothetical protein